MMSFAIARMDGRSNQQVLIDHVKNGKPGDMFSFDELAAALSAGSDRIFGVQEVRGVVAMAATRLLKEQARTLVNIRGFGYRLAPGSDHAMLAKGRRDKAAVQIVKAKSLLEHVRWDEMDPNQRLAHEGTLMLVSALYEQQRAFNDRLRKVEETIKAAVATA